MSLVERLNNTVADAQRLECNLVAHLNDHFQFIPVCRDLGHLGNSAQMYGQCRWFLLQNKADPLKIDAPKAKPGFDADWDDARSPIFCCLNNFFGARSVID